MLLETDADESIAKFAYTLRHLEALQDEALTTSHVKSPKTLYFSSHYFQCSAYAKAPKVIPHTDNANPRISVIPETFSIPST